MKTKPDLPSVCVEALNKSMGDNCLLSNVNFTLAAGSTLLLLGRQGSGKTILLKIVAGLIPLDSGKISIDGNDIGALGEADLQDARRAIGFLFQSAALFASLSVADNIAFPLRYGNALGETEVKVAVDSLLEEIGLEDVAHKRPFELSRGTRKLAAFARALARRPKLLILDDPWSDTDHVAKDAMRSALLARKRNQSLTCLITDNYAPSLLEATDQVAVLQDTTLKHFMSLPEASEHLATRQYMLGLERGH